MAKYDYRCTKCEIEENITHSMTESPTILCSKCGAEMKKTVPKSVNFVLKGANWAGKNIREKGYREQRRRELGKKMAISHDIQQIQPNYKGEVCASWDEAKNLAKADGVDPLRYEKQVKTLKSTQQKVEEKRNKLARGEG